MIISYQRKKVVAKIKQNIKQNKLNSQAELNDPELSIQASNQVIQKYWAHKHQLLHKIVNLLIRGLFNIITSILTKDDRIVFEEETQLPTKAIITSNHYNQLDPLPIKKLALKNHRRLYYLVKDTNLVMHFPIGMILRNADSIPVNGSIHYLGRELPTHIKRIFQHNCWLLIYPEEELWFNYRKPRPLQKGAYYYAAEMKLPVISCFAEIQTKNKRELFHRDFYKTKIVLHVLPTIYPDTNLSTHDNAIKMRNQDFFQKKQAYEKYYGKKLTYNFSLQDIAGYAPISHKKKIDKC